MSCRITGALCESEVLTAGQREIAGRNRASSHYGCRRLHPIFERPQKPWSSDLFGSSEPILGIARSFSAIPSGGRFCIAKGRIYPEYRDAARGPNSGACASASVEQRNCRASANSNQHSKVSPLEYSFKNVCQQPA